MARNGGQGVKDEEEEEEHHRNPFLSNGINKPCPSRPQFRSEISKAKWNEEMGMGEIIEKKGSMWTTIGVVRNGKLYCHIEEILFLAERGALILTSPDDMTFSLGDIYRKFAGLNTGYSWESFEAYKHLKLLGYIVQRHGISWTSKNDRICPSSNYPSESKGGTCVEVEDRLSNLLEGMQINNLKPMFNVYLPNSKFRKSSPGDPSFLLCLSSRDFHCWCFEIFDSICFMSHSAQDREKPPSWSELECLEKSFYDLPLKFCYIDHGRVSFFSFDKETLPTLP